MRAGGGRRFADHRLILEGINPGGFSPGGHGPLFWSAQLLAELTA
jgi:hypothetical protein